ncbi:hypothetical protein T459_04763 [Capsicum annuum]|uniref:Cystatin domain-containing protein n=1 Tax=Capsicum annuum TaxID=4072 RepID=A0A2G3A630_CAPAN|nr:hypothetical protein T459_04763 [Capsicum annuum]
MVKNITTLMVIILGIQMARRCTSDIRKSITACKYHSPLKTLSDEGHSQLVLTSGTDANNKFVENLTVNTSFAAGMWCYITFIATDADDLNAPKTFQALAWWGIDGKREVEFRRLKKPSD